MTNQQQQYPPSQQPQYPQAPQAPPIPNYLYQAILTTLCCCLPLGIVAILKANKVNEFLAAGNFQAAQHASEEAKKWCWIAFGLGLVINGLVASLQLFSFIMAANADRFG